MLGRFRHAWTCTTRLTQISEWGLQLSAVNRRAWFLWLECAIFFVWWVQARHKATACSHLPSFSLYLFVELDRHAENSEGKKGIAETQLPWGESKEALQTFGCSEYLSNRGSSASATRLAGVCNECYPILSRYADTVRGLTHQGSDLIRCKSIHPNPKRTNFTHYRCVKKQNDWLRQSVFDSMGNYLYCGVCVHSALGIGRQRIARQLQIKRLQSQQPLSQMTKTNVEEKHLAEFVVMPDGTETSFKTWWKTITPTQLVSITDHIPDMEMLERHPILRRPQSCRIFYSS